MCYKARQASREAELLFVIPRPLPELCEVEKARRCRDAVRSVSRITANSTNTKTVNIT
jgi:hypothetical protein